MESLHTEIDLILQRAARMAATYLRENENPEEPVARYLPPDQLRQILDLSLPEAGRSLEELLPEIEKYLHYSVRTGHPRFYNQLFGGYDLAALLGEWMTAVLNSSMYTYEVAPVATLMERALTQRMARLAGFQDGEGVFAPGGSISNLMAVLAARNWALPHVKQTGLRPGDRPVLFASKEAHYSIRRAASICGLGLEAVEQIPVDDQGRIRPDALEERVRFAMSQGLQPFMVVATCGTTVPGAFDPVPPIVQIAKRYGMWCHVDASMGGAAFFSRKHRHLLDGSELADSLTWNPHKLMGVPLTCSVLLVRERGRLAATHALGADYLFHDDAEVSCDLGDNTIQCGRRMDALKLWLAWQVHGDQGYEKRVDYLLSIARTFREKVMQRPGFQLVLEPQSWCVCFHYLPPRLRNLPPGEERDSQLEVATVTLRDRLRSKGRTLINYAPIKGIATFRIVFANPEVTEQHLDEIFDEMDCLGHDL